MREFSILYSSLTPTQAEVADKIFEKMDLVSEGLREPEVKQMEGKKKRDIAIIIIGLAIMFIMANRPL